MRALSLACPILDVLRRELDEPAHDDVFLETAQVVDTEIHPEGGAAWGRPNLTGHVTVRVYSLKSAMWIQRLSLAKALHIERSPVTTWISSRIARASRSRRRSFRRA